MIKSHHELNKKISSEKFGWTDIKGKFLMEFAHFVLRRRLEEKTFKEEKVKMEIVFR